MWTTRPPTTVSTDVTDARGRVVIPAGARVTMTLTEIRESENKGDKTGKLTLTPTEVAIGGRTYPLAASAEALDRQLKDRKTNAGDVAKVSDPDPAKGGRESAVVGVSYSLNRRLTGRVAVGADRSDGRALTPLRKADNYSLDVGGAYSVTRNIAVTGGVRYRIDHERLSAVTDARRDSQAVYVGTAFKF